MLISLAITRGTLCLAYCSNNDRLKRCVSRAYFLHFFIDWKVLNMLTQKSPQITLRLFGGFFDIFKVFNTPLKRRV